MFQLYKNRNFNTLVNDTFNFIKAEGKNYFSNYITINGGPLLLLMIMVFIVMKYFFSGILGGMSSPWHDAVISNYFESNTGYFIGLGVIFGILVLLLSLLNVTYPVVYLHILSHGEKPTTKLLFKGIMARAGRLIIFGLASLITFLPVAAIVAGISVLLFIIIVGIPVAFIIWAALLCWIMLSLYDNISTERNFFTALKNGYNMLFRNFWAHMGTTAIFLIISFVLQLASNLISSLISMLGIYITGESSPESISLFTIAMFIISTAISYFFGSVIMLSHGMIYYSCKEGQENKTMQSEIDLIGSNVE